MLPIEQRVPSRRTAVRRRNWRRFSKRSATRFAPCEKRSKGGQLILRTTAMFEPIKRLVLRLLRVPAEPEPPFGQASSIRVFRASRKLYWLRLIGWSAAQVLALAGIIFWFSVLLATEHEAARAKADRVARGQPAPRLKAGRHRPLSQGFKDAAARI